MPGLATITWADNHRQVIHEQEKHIAIEAYLLLKGRKPEYDEARATLKHVALPPSWIPARYRKSTAYDPWSRPEASTKLTHSGIEQGMSQAIPSGDR